MRLVAKHVRQAARVLDLASGTGAFLARLRDSGYRNLAAVELNVEGFRLEGVAPSSVDLNSNFAAALPHDHGLITAIEIIEHLDCPRRFLRNVRELLTDGGYLLLTTPNVAHWLGRMRFLISGELRQFQRRDYDHQRHISPLTNIQLQLIFEELGFEIVERATAGTFFGSLKRAIFWPLEMVAGGDVLIYLVRKTARTTSSAGRDSFYFKSTGA